MLECSLCETQATVLTRGRCACCETMVRSAHPVALKLLAARRRIQELETERSESASWTKYMRLQGEVHYLESAIARGGWDLSPCVYCGCTVVCLPDGLPCCDDCATAAAKEQ